MSLFGRIFSLNYIQPCSCESAGDHLVILVSDSRRAYCLPSSVSSRLPTVRDEVTQPRPIAFWIHADRPSRRWSFLTTCSSAPWDPTDGSPVSNFLHNKRCVLSTVGYVPCLHMHLGTADVCMHVAR